jgi:hypothetical protein
MIKIQTITKKAILAAVILVMIIFTRATSSFGSNSHVEKQDSGKREIVFRPQTNNPVSGKEDRHGTEIKPSSYVSHLPSAFCFRVVQEAFLVFQVFVKENDFKGELPYPTLSQRSYKKVLFRSIISPNAP